MNNENVKIALDKFLKQTIKKAQNNLKGRGIDASGELSKSFTYDLTVSPNSFSAKIFAKRYAKFIDEGVSGVEKKRNTPYSYKRKGGSGSLKGMPPPSAFDKWSIRRAIAPRSTLGTFLPRKSVNFAIAVGVFKHGIKPTYFFKDAYENEFNKLSNEVIEAYALDTENFLNFIWQ